MGLVRAASVVVKPVVGLLVVVPLLALVVAMILDSGPDGALRGSIFGAALVLFDPFVWDCLGRSAAVAGLVAGGSLVLGTALARTLSRWWFWGRGPLAALVWAPVVLPPLCGALGLRLLFGPAGPSPLGTLAGSPGRPWNWEIGGAWACWVWVALTSGVALVSLVVAGALERIDPAWEQAGRMAGASRRQVWRSLGWPLVRPAAYRAAATVFGFTLLEPGAPLVLRLRRTLGFQVVEAATGSGSLTRAAVLVGLGLGVSGAILGLARLLGGRPWPLPALAARNGRRRAPWWRAALLTTVLGGWILLAWGPYLALLSAELPADLGPPSRWLEAFRGVPGAAQAGWAVLHSAALGAGVAMFGLLLAWLTTLPRSGGPPRSDRMAALVRLPEILPPLAVGVGVLAVPTILATLALDARTGPEAGRLLDALAGAIDPFRMPGMALGLALLIVRLSLLVRVVETARSRRDRERESMARVLGASRRRAWWDASGRRIVPALLAGGGLAAALAASDTASALVLAQTMACRPAGPTILDLADTPGGLPAAAVLAALVVVVNLMALLLFARLGRPARVDAQRV